MNYDKKSIEEIIEEFKQWPDNEFFPFFRHETLHYVTLIKGSAELLEKFLEEDPLDKESCHGLLDDIQKYSEGLRNLLFARAKYDTLLHGDFTEKNDN